ncbi:MAG: alpha/beta hydrolase-fold protein [Longimicrobiales bacterium]
MKNLRHYLCIPLLALTGWGCGGAEEESTAALSFAVTLPAASSAEPLDGRLLVMIAKEGEREPRFQISSGPTGQQVFGVDVEGMEPGVDVEVGGTVVGFPLTSLREIPKGTYWVQALLNRYETYHRADGQAVKLPPERGEGQKWNLKPGNLYSAPREILIDPSSDEVIHLTLDQEIPPFPEREDTKYIKHVRIQSEVLTEFWGEPTSVEAIVLLPQGWDEHPNARYPLMVYQGHHSRVFATPVGFRETPPTPQEGLEGAGLALAEASYRFYEDWTGPDFPRFIIVTIQHANPYYDDSYAVNSANLGPYGDALTYELIPYIEAQYRGIGEGWARVLYGGSTGGWESLAAQIFYPDEYNGTWTFCPDPIDFRAYTVVDIYNDRNAYYLDSDWKRTPRPGRRNWLGHISSTLEEDNHLESVIASHGRSGDQWDIWQAVFSPVGEDGYPKPIWDKRSGEIDPEVAAYWRDHYDLRYILERDWKTLGPKLRGKLHIYVGDMDNYYLNNAVYLMEDFLEGTDDPPYGGLVEYGDRFEHCWSGDHDNPNQVSRLTINQRMAPLMLRRILASAPSGADVTSWRY